MGFKIFIIIRQIFFGINKFIIIFVCFRIYNFVFIIIITVGTNSIGSSIHNFIFSIQLTISGIGISGSLELFLNKCFVFFCISIFDVYFLVIIADILVIFIIIFRYIIIIHIPTNEILRIFIFHLVVLKLIVRFYFILLK